MVKGQLSKVIRVVTIAPVMALLLLIELYFALPKNLSSISNFILSIIFLVIFPVLAYPLQTFIPKYRDKGREGQRSLAIITANLGYCLGMLSAAFMAVTAKIWVIYLTYFISGILIFLFNKVFKVRASGHACGVAGPIFASIYYVGPAAFLGFIILAAVYWASLYIKRHTLSELIIGTLIPAFSLAVAVLFAKLIF